MIPAEKNWFWDMMLYRYLMRMLRGSFHSIEVAGIENLRGLDPKRPTIAFANHTNWWDGLMVFFLTRYNRRKRVFCMMDERQLRNNTFFRWLGAFSVDQQNAIRAAASARYALKALKLPSTMLWIFPQGKMESVYEPIRIREGIDLLATRTPKAQMLPLAFRYEFFREEKPQVLIRIGEPYDALDSTHEQIETSLKREVETLDQNVRENDFSDYRMAMPPRWSINKRWEWVVQRVRGTPEDFKSTN